MSNIVSLQALYYPVILRVVLGRIITYRSLIIECTEVPSGFSMQELRDLFSIKTEDDWLDETLDELNFAKKELAKKARDLSLARKVTVSQNGFFVVVRPKLDEVEKRDHCKSEQSATDTSAMAAVAEKKTPPRRDQLLLGAAVFFFIHTVIFLSCPDRLNLGIWESLRKKLARAGGGGRYSMPCLRWWVFRVSCLSRLPHPTRSNYSSTFPRINIVLVIRRKAAFHASQIKGT